jgi:hypothetical protein
MTPIEKWALDLATEMAKDDTEADRSIQTTLVQRFTIALIQARALECRKIAAQCVESKYRGHVFYQIMHAYLIEKSHQLEKIATALATQWPPQTDGEIPAPEDGLRLQ